MKHRSMPYLNKAFWKTFGHLREYVIHICLNLDIHHILIPVNINDKKYINLQYASTRV